MQKTLSSLVCCAFFLVLVFTAPTALAQCDCDFVIPLNAWQVDGNTLKGVNGQVGVKPGDKVCFASGIRADITFSNFQGAPGNPIIVTNMCDGQAIVKGLTAGTGRLMYMGNCQYIRVTGTGNPGIQYGIEMTVGVQAIDFRDLSTDVEADHIYVHDIGYSAFNAKTDPTCDPRTWRGAFTMRNVSFHDNKVSNTGGEGIYIGESHFNTTVPVVCLGITLQAQEHEVIGAKVYNNIFENIGRDAIQVGAVTSGGEIHHNKITNFGTTNEYGQQSGIQINPGTNAEIYNNVIDTGTGFGLFAGGRGGSHVYNNIIMNCQQGGIICADYPPLDPSGFIFSNNTLINNKVYGIYMLSENTLSNQWVNNINVGPASNFEFVHLNNPNKIKWTASNNIETNDINSVKFVNGAGKDLHLQATSPAKDAGKDMRGFGVTLDLDNLARPQGTAADIGAYEVSGGGSNPTPTVNAGGNKVVTLPTNATSLAGSASDPGGAISSYAWTKVAGGTCAMANADKSTLSVTGMSAGNYRFKLTVKDDAGATASDEAEVTVSTVSSGANIAPVANAGADRTVGLPLTSLALNGSATDSDGTVMYWEWTKVSGGLLTLLDIGKPTLLLSALLPGTYTFRLKVTDDKGAVGTDDVTITIDPLSTINTPPVANAGVDKTITLPTNTTTLPGSGTDANGTITRYAWTKVSGGVVALTNATTPTLGLIGVVAGTYTFRLTVTDNSGATASDDVVLTVNAASTGTGGNAAPVAKAGNDKIITLPANALTIAGSGTDADGTVMYWEWTKVSGGAATLANIGTPTLSVSGLVAGTYTFRLKITDNSGAVGSDDVVITVNAGSASNVAPVANAGADKTITLPTSSLTITGSGTDADGTIAYYAWAKISGGAVTLANAGTAALSLSGLVAGAYTFRLTVTDDSGMTGTDDVIVTVKAASTGNAAPVANAGTDKTLTLPTNALTIAGSGTDTDGTVMYWEWTKISGGAATLANVGASTLSVSNLAAGTYTFRLKITDNSGAVASDDVTVTVNAGAAAQPPAGNTAPVANAGVDQTITLPTTSTILYGGGTDADGTVMYWEWTKVSGGAATLTNAGAATLNLSGLAAGTYTFRLKITDNSGTMATDDVTVTVKSNVNLAPVANGGADATITAPTSAVTLWGNATDADGTVMYWEWTKVSGGAAVLTDAGKPTLQLSGLVAGTYVFRLRVTDNLGATGSDEVTVTVKAAGAATSARAATQEYTSLAEPADSSVDANTDYNSGVSEEDFNFLDKQFPSGHQYAIVIYDPNGKRLYSGAWSAELYDSIFPQSGFYVYHILQDGAKIDGGKVYITR